MVEGAGAWNISFPALVRQIFVVDRFAVGAVGIVHRASGDVVVSALLGNPHFLVGVEVDTA